MESIKRILDSEAGLLVTSNNDIDRKVVDNRFELLKEYIDSLNNRDDNFYAQLIKLISNYLNKLYEIEINDFPVNVLDEDGKLMPQDYDTLKLSDIIKLHNSNQNLSKNLFDYVCYLLETNKDIKLDRETLVRLLNRNPKLFSLSVEKSYLYRQFDFIKLVEIINKNQTLKKSNINIDEVYQLLIDTCQIDNEEIFRRLISVEEFKENHKKIIDFLDECNAEMFVNITNIIIKYYDKDFDRMSIIKKRKENNYCERVIISLLKSYPDESEFNFIHQLLTDESINIDYNYYFADYIGQTSLKELLAFSGNKAIIKELLNNKDNIQNYYYHGEFCMPLYRLYAIIGEYEKSITIFKQTYNYADDFTEDYSKGFNNEGYAYGDIIYRDSLVAYIESISNSFKNENIDYSTKKYLISSILNSENVEYINLEEILPIFKEELTEEDFKLLLDSLIEKYNSNRVGFIVVNDFCSYYKIEIANDEKVKEVLSEFKDVNKVLR